MEFHISDIIVVHLMSIRTLSINLLQLVVMKGVKWDFSWVMGSLLFDVFVVVAQFNLFLQ